MLGPYQVPFEPKGPIAGHTRVYFFGIAGAVTEVFDRHGYAYQQAMSRCPKAIEDFITAGRPIPLNESVSLARTLIQIEEQISPGVVGGGVSVVEIPPNGRASDVIEDLPKTNSGKHKKTK